VNRGRADSPYKTRNPCDRKCSCDALGGKRLVQKSTSGSSLAGCSCSFLVTQVVVYKVNAAKGLGCGYFLGRVTTWIC